MGLKKLISKISRDERKKFKNERKVENDLEKEENQESGELGLLRRLMNLSMQKIALTKGIHQIERSRADIINKGRRVNGQLKVMGSKYFKQIGKRTKLGAAKFVQKYGVDSANYIERKQKEIEHELQLLRNETNQCINLDNTELQQIKQEVQILKAQEPLGSKIFNLIKKELKESIDEEKRISNDLAKEKKELQEENAALRKDLEQLRAIKTGVSGNIKIN